MEYEEEDPQSTKRPLQLLLPTDLQDRIWLSCYKLLYPGRVSEGRGCAPADAAELLLSSGKPLAIGSRKTDLGPPGQPSTTRALPELRRPSEQTKLSAKQKQEKCIID